MGGQGRKEEGRIQRRILQGRERQTLGGHVESGEETMHVSITKCQLPPTQKKREIAQTTHHRWRFDSCLSPPTFTLSNHTNFSLMRFKFEAHQTWSSDFSKSCGWILARTVQVSCWQSKAKAACCCAHAVTPESLKGACGDCASVWVNQSNVLRARNSGNGWWKILTIQQLADRNGLFTPQCSAGITLPRDAEICSNCKMSQQLKCQAKHRLKAHSRRLDFNTKLGKSSQIFFFLLLLFVTLRL